MNKPNLFIVGAPKCGTTSMFSYLQQHPDIFMSNNKEPHYFGSDLTRIGNLYNFTENEYLKLFLNANNEKIIGEASTHYLYSKTAPKEIKSFNKESKIIIMLRNPVDLIYSLHSQYLFSNNEDQKDFQVALKLENQRKKGLYLPKHINIVEKVFYKTYLKRLPNQIKKYIEIFSKENVSIILLEDLIRNPSKTYKDILTFLNVDNLFLPKFTNENPNKVIRNKMLHNIRISLGPIIGKVRQKLFKESFGFMEKIKKYNTKFVPRIPLDPEIYNNLNKEFKPIVDELEIVLNRELLHWYNS